MHLGDWHAGGNSSSGGAGGSGFCIIDWSRSRSDHTAAETAPHGRNVALAALSASFSSTTSAIVNGIIGAGFRFLVSGKAGKKGGRIARTTPRTCASFQFVMDPIASERFYEYVERQARRESSSLQPGRVQTFL